MLGRFLHWYPGYTAEAALTMPAVRFFALSKAIRQLEAAEDLRRLRIAATAAHPGDKGDHLADYQDELVTALGLTAGSRQRTTQPVIPGLTPGVSESAEDLRAELARRAAAHAERMAVRKKEP